MARPITFAVPKGRLIDEALPLMVAAGVEPGAEFFDPASRALRFATARADRRLIRVRAFDVATFVAHGAAEIGIVGSDVLDEFGFPELYAPVDLGIGRCRLSVAVPEAMAHERPRRFGQVRVATKYPNLTRRHHEARGVAAEIVKLNGAMELAPLLGLAGRIVDLVSTGRTLAENGLVEVERVLEVSARLIVNRAALKRRPDELMPLIRAFRQAAGRRPREGAVAA